MPWRVRAVTLPCRDAGSRPQVSYPVGGRYGSTRVDEEFDALVRRLMRELYSEFSRTVGAVELRASWEDAKARVALNLCTESAPRAERRVSCARTHRQLTARGELCARDPPAASGRPPSTLPPEGCWPMSSPSTLARSRNSCACAPGGTPGRPLLRWGSWLLRTTPLSPRRAGTGATC